LTSRIVTLQITQHRPNPAVAVLELKGSIHAGPDCHHLEEETLNAMNGNENRFVLDLSGVTHIDSAAVGTIVKCFSRAKKSGKTLCLAGLTGMVAGTLKLTQVDKVIQVYPTASQAAE
jgi:anti-sigma B factor antagonist